MSDPARPRIAELGLSRPGSIVLIVDTGEPTSGPSPSFPAAGPAAAELGRVLVERCGLNTDSLRMLTEPVTATELGLAISDAAETATDLLLVYYLGHLVQGQAGDLHLATAATDPRPDRLGLTALPLTSALTRLQAGRATERGLMIDGCLITTRYGSSQTDDAVCAAAPVLTKAQRGVIEEQVSEIDLTLSAVWTGSGDDAPTVRPDYDRAEAEGTPLSQELLRLLLNGDPDGPPELTVDRLYHQGARNLVARGCPRPLRRAGRWADTTVLAHNPAHTPPIPDVEAPDTRVLTALPTPLAEAGRIAHEPGQPGQPGVQEVDGRSDVASEVACPYPGLASFDRSSMQWFFGRERATADLLTRLDARLTEAGPLMIVGPSGSGKSSLLRAGMLPALTNGALSGSRRWQQIVLTPTDHPVRELAEQMVTIGNLPIPIGGTLESIVTQRDPFITLLSEVSGRRAGLEATADDRVVLVIDQFEETFTLCADDAERTAFVGALSAAARGTENTSPPAVVVLGLRADFYGRCAAFPELIEALQRGPVVVGPMSAAEVRDAIVCPAEAVGLAVEPGLVELIIHDLGAGDERVVTDPGSLPLLAHALLATWQERDGEVLTVAGYRRSGGLHGAIATTAEHTYAHFDAAGQDAARRLMLRMVRIGDRTDDTRLRVRRDVLLAEAGEPAAAAAVLDALIAARLVTVDAGGVQITHEALLRSWPRLREWIDIDRAGALTRQQIADATETWDTSGRDPSYLFSGTRLAGAREWAAASDRRGGLSPPAQDFVTAGIAREQAETAHTQRRTRRLKQLVAVLTVLVLLSTGATVFALQQRSSATAARDRALSQRIATQADTLRPSDPGVAAQLGVVAYRLARTPEARSAVLSSFSSGYGFATRHLAGHTRAVGAVAYSRDGRLVATASDDWTVKLWDATNPRRPDAVGTLRGHQLAAKSVAFSPDGRTVATGSDDRTVKLWDITDPARPAVRTTLPTAASSVFGLAYSPDNRLLATGGYGDTVRLWDVGNPSAVALAGTVTGHHGAIRAVAFSPDGKVLATGSEDGTAKLWNVTDPGSPGYLSDLTGDTGGNVADPDTRIRAVAFSGDGTSIVTGSNDSEARVFSITDPKSPSQVQVIDSVVPIVSIAFSPDSRMVAIATGDVVELHNAHDYSDTVSSFAHGAAAWAVAFSPDGRSLATGADGGSVKLWDTPGPVLFGHRRFLWSVDASPKGHVIATGDYDNTVRLWDVSNQYNPVSISVLTGHTGATGAVTFRPDGRVLATGSIDKTIKLWDVADPRNPVSLATVTTDIDAVNDLSFSPDGQTMLAAGDSGGIQLWNVTDPRQPQALAAMSAAHPSGASAAVFSPDGTTVASAGKDRTVRLWDVRDRTRPVEIGRLTQFGSGVYGVAFSSDGRTLATGGSDRTITLWDVSTPGSPRLRSTLTGHGGRVNTVAFSPDNRTLASGAADSTVRLWDIHDTARPALLADLRGYYNAFSEVAFSPNGATLYGAPFQVVGFTWDLDPDTVIQRVCDRVGDPLTRSEWAQYVGDLPYKPPCQS